MGQFVVRRRRAQAGANPGRPVAVVSGVLELPHWRGRLAALVMVALPALSAGEAGAPLTLAEAERLALEMDPVVLARRARSAAISEQAIADGELPDPRLRLGLYNLPLDTLDIDQQPTTQLRVGVQQAFPRGETLLYQQKRAQWRASAEQAGAEDTARRLVRDVREQYLELYYQISAAGIVQQSRRLFVQLVDITQAHYASGRVNQQDVLRAELELSRLEERLIRIRKGEDTSRARLGKWLGGSAFLPLPGAFPQLPPLPGLDTLREAIPDHPAMISEGARIASSNQAVNIAREQYHPGWSVGVEYRRRFGDNPDGSERSDMAAAMLTVDLPLFTDKRQDRGLAAAQSLAQAARYTRDDKLRDLRSVLERDHASWKRLGESQELYGSRLLREAGANARASLNAYQSGVTRFTVLMRARLLQLDMQLKALRVRVDRAKAHARLLYLAPGENS